MPQPPIAPPEWPAEPPSPAQKQRSITMFLLTLASVYLVFGYQWMGGDPLRDGAVAWDSFRFAGTLMAILLAHEMGHYLVARHHGFRLSLPYFLPFPFAFGTLGAVIRLESMPRSRTALLEMGAAGPLAGFVLAIAAMFIGLPATTDPGAIVLPLSAAEALQAIPAAVDPAWWEPVVGVLLLPLVALESLLEWTGAVPSVEPSSLMVSILANPPLMDLVGFALNGAAPGRYADLDPVAFAGWVGCLLTAINLIPIGQLDGGHILNALAPQHSRSISRAGVVVLMVAGVLFWPGWAVWGVLLLMMRAWVSLPVPERPPLSTRAKVLAGLTLLAFALSFMPRPIEIESVPYDAIQWTDEEGIPTAPPPGLFSAEEEARGG